MGNQPTSLEGEVADFIGNQKMFFVGTAPLDGGGHVNISPKGLDALRILGPTTLGYVDLTGSGCETLAHVRENGRIVFMFCAFEGPPRIVRVHGTGRVIEPRDAAWGELAPRFPDYRSARTLILADVTRIAKSCGYGVPLMAFEAQRTQLVEWADKKGADGIASYLREKNARSIDGLPGVGID